MFSAEEQTSLLNNYTFATNPGDDDTSAQLSADTAPVRSETQELEASLRQEGLRRTEAAAAAFAAGLTAALAVPAG